MFDKIIFGQFWEYLFNTNSNMKKQLFILIAFLPIGLFANNGISKTGAAPLSVSHFPETAVVDTSFFETDSLQKPYILDDMPLVRVQQDSLIELLLKEKIYGKSEQVEIDGFRVQIFSSNRQQTAKEEALTLEKKMTETLSTAVYVTYISPFWKVRLGNFRTLEEAKAFKAQLITQFPERQGDTYIVRDKIQVRK